MLNHLASAVKAAGLAYRLLSTSVLIGLLAVEVVKQVRRKS